MSHSNEWMLRWLPDSLVGGIPGRDCAEVFCSLSLEIEDAHLSPEGSEESEVCGAGGDVEKCFDTIPSDIAHWTLRALGMNECIVRPLEGFYRNLSSRLLLNGAVGPARHRQRGAFQGDPLAMLKLNAIMAPVAWSISAIPGVRYWQYCDDPLIIARTRHGPIRVQEAVSLLERFLRICRQNASAKKSYAFAASSLQRGEIASV